jgi:hypothetical protein
VPARERAHIAAAEDEKTSEHRNQSDGGYDDECARHG